MASSKVTANKKCGKCNNIAMLIEHLDGSRTRYLTCIEHTSDFMIKYLRERGYRIK